MVGKRVCHDDHGKTEQFTGTVICSHFWEIYYAQILWWNFVEWY